MTRLYILCAVMLAAFHTHTNADEPVSQMLDGLRELEYFDTALAYLDRIDSGKIEASDAAKSELLLERSYTLVKAASNTRLEKDLEDYLDRSEVAVRKFIETQAKHQRADEGRTQLATLLQVRGRRLAKKTNVTDAEKAKAITLLESSVKSFEEIVETIRARLKEMQGQKIEDPEEVALRTKYRDQFLTAMFYSGTTRLELAVLFPDKDPKQKKTLEDALKVFTDLTEKYSDKPAGAMAMFHRGEAQEKLGKPKEALDSYVRMLEYPNEDILRNEQLGALVGAAKIWLSNNPPQYKETIEKSTSFLSRMTPQEKSDPTWQMLGLLNAKAFLVQADVMEKEKAGSTKVKGAKREARRLLVAAAKVPGDHQAEAAKLLGEMGVDVEEAGDAPPTDIKTFADAMERGRELFNESESQSLPLKLVEEQLAKTPNDAELLKQQKAIEEDIVRQRSQAIEIFQMAPRLATSETPIDEINQSRYFMSFLMLKERRLRECLVVSEFLCRSFPSDALAPQWGQQAVIAYQGILGQNAENPPEAMLSGLEDLAQYLMERWPNDGAASTAAEILVRVALVQGETTKAAKYLGKIPADAPQRVSLQQMIGQFQWNEYLKLAADGDSPETKAALETAITSLAGGLKGLEEKQVDGSALLSAWILARGYVVKDDPTQAFAVLDNPAYGPLKRLEGKNPIPPPNEDFASGVYRTTLQVLVSLATGDKPDPKALERAEKVIDKLRDSVKGTPNAEKRLVNTYYLLANEIRAQLDTAQPAKRQQLVEAFSLLLSKLAQTTTDVTTLHWIGQTFLQLASSLDSSDGPFSGKAKDLLGDAGAALKKALDAGARDLEPQIRFEYGKSLRLAGKFRDALTQFEELLSKKATMLDAQMEGAWTLEQWADNGGNAQFYMLAANGFSSKDPKASTKTIWGWGKISTLTLKNEQFREIFFKSRYHLDRCQIQLGKKTDNAKNVENGLKDILLMNRRYPELGGKAMRTKYDQLAKEAQGFLKQPADGLPVEETPVSAPAK